MILLSEKLRFPIKNTLKKLRFPIILPSKNLRLTIPRKGWHFLERLTNRVYITTETVYNSSFDELFLFTFGLIQFTVSFFICPEIVPFQTSLFVVGAWSARRCCNIFEPKEVTVGESPA